MNSHYVKDFKDEITPRLDPIMKLALIWIVGTTIVFLGHITAAIIFMMSAIIFMAVHFMYTDVQRDKMKSDQYQAYYAYLGTIDLTDMVRVLNDPDRNEQTKDLIRAFMSKKCPGWHTEIVMPVGNNQPDLLAN